MGPQLTDDAAPSVWESILCLAPMFVLSVFVGYHAVVKISGVLVP